MGAILMAFPGVALAAPSTGVALVRAPSLKTLEIATVPPVPAARFAFDGQTLVTDGDGIARVTLPRSRDLHHLELLTPHLDAPGGLSLDFTRWVGRGDSDQGFTTSLPKVVLEHNKRIQATFQATKLVNLDFVDQAHNAVASSRVSSLTIRSDSGHIRTLRGGESMQLTAVRPAVEAGSAVAKEVTYYLDSVIIDGSNVVNAGEQRVAPSRTDSATFVVLLRSVHFQIRDRLFGHPIEAEMVVTYPDGTSSKLSTAQDGGVKLENLARGTYTIKVAGPGYTQLQTVTLSRSQYVDLPVLSYLDMGVMAGALLVILLCLVVFGRRLHAKRSREEDT
jgi:hypothetical protein